MAAVPRMSFRSSRTPFSWLFSCLRRLSPPRRPRKNQKFAPSPRSSLDPDQYKQQVTDTLTMLRNAKARYGLAGYEVQTIRITTQPFPEYTRGMSKQAVLAFFHDLDSLAKQENVSISIGPALMDEKDDPAQAELLGEILGQSNNVYGSVVVAGSDGVHVKAVHAAAGIMKYLE